MKKLPELHVGKGLFKTIFILSIALFSLGLILDIVSLVQTALGYVLSSNWALYASLIIDTILCIGFVFASATIVLWDPDNYGGTLLYAAGLYVVISGIVSAISGIMLALCYEEVSYAVPAIISIIQIGIGSMSLIVRNRKPGAAMIISIVSFGVFALNNLVTAIGYVVAGQALLSVFIFIAIAFDVAVIVALGMMKNRN